MKKIVLFIALLIAALALLGWLGWERKTTVAAHLLKRHLGVPVSIQNLDLKRQGANIDSLTIGNPYGFRSSSALTVDAIAIDTTWQKLRADPLTIDRIEMDNLLITIETSAKGTTNWDIILNSSNKNSSSKRHWLLRTLTLNNLTVRVVNADGSVKQYPTLKRMEFYNLSDETGFPVSEIEKAILNEVIQNLLRNFDLQNLLKPVLPNGQYLPSLPKLF